jgi:hypothetical protein
MNVIVKDTRYSLAEPGPPWDTPGLMLNRPRFHAASF